jgi:hypothetical protein
MQICDPQELLDLVDRDILEQYLGYQPFECEPVNNQLEVHFSEPYGTDNTNSVADASIIEDSKTAEDKPESQEPVASANSHEVLKGKILRLGDFIDTDAVYLTPKAITRLILSQLLTLS